MDFNIEDYIIECNSNKEICIRDKLGIILNIGDTVYLTDTSNMHRNSIKGVITKCFVGLSNLPYIRVNRECSQYEHRKYNYANKKHCNDEKISVLCLKDICDDGLIVVPL